MEMDRVIGVRSDKTVFRAKDKVIKMFDDGYSKSDILNEALNQSRIEEMGMNIPKILEVGKIDGRWAIIQEFIEGKQLEYLMGTNPEKMAEYLDNMAQLQWDMHQKKPPLLNKLTDTLTRKIAACDLNATVRYDIIAQLQEMPKGNSLCHGDFVPGNIIVGTKGEYFMLDFSHSCVGNPLADVAKSYILLGLHFGEDIAEKYIALYCDKSGGKPEDVKKWLRVVAASELCYVGDEVKQILTKFLSR